MSSHTFTCKTINADGSTYQLLTANEYPYSVLQIVSFDESNHDEFLKNFRANYQGWIIEYPDCKNFIVLHRGSARRIELNQNNVNQVTDAIITTMHDAARCWAKKEDIEIEE